MIQGLEHAGLASPDPEKLAQWYVERLGFRINYHSPSSRNLFLRAPNGSMFEIILSEGERSPQTVKTPGLRHLAIAVDDFDRDYAQLKAKGVQSTITIYPGVGHAFVKSTNFKNPGPAQQAWLQMVSFLKTSLRG